MIGPVLRRDFIDPQRVNYMGFVTLDVRRRMAGFEQFPFRIEGQCPLHWLGSGGEIGKTHNSATTHYNVQRRGNRFGQLQGFGRS